tara:strand:- start:1237 stop:2136 length:900 start_codon:yes stop_codon:yes gene_type:complete
MAVYDCFPFFNENDLLELRINQHWDFVDKFIITESCETHTGSSKPYNFDSDRFKKYSSKIIYNRLGSFSEEIAVNSWLLDGTSLRDRSGAGQFTEDWVRDHFQGNYPVKVLTDIGASDNDIIYISALDEILSEKGFKEGLSHFETETENTFSGHFRWPNKTAPSVGFMLDMYVYKFNLFSKKISVGQMTQLSVLKQMLPSTCRMLSMSTHPSVRDAGWHFSFLDNCKGEKVLDKYKSWAHSRDKTDSPSVPQYYNIENKEEAVDRLKGIYNPVKVEISESTHPKWLLDNIELYRDYIEE